jgi:hypothetical protein
MSSRIILNNQVINDLIYSKTIALETKYQRKSDNKNYFFSPNIGLKLFNAKISWIDPSKKNISFAFNKYDNLSLLNMLRYINEKLTCVYNNKSIYPKTISPFFFEKDDLFYIRCYLPNTGKGKYHIQSYFNNELEIFNIPKLSSSYNTIIIDIRNIWEDDNKAGFNLELKETSLNIM